MNTTELFNQDLAGRYLVNIPSQGYDEFYLGHNRLYYQFALQYDL